MTVRFAMQGLGSRVTIIARAIALDAAPKVDWIINDFCPFGHRLVFPNGIPGVEMFDSEPNGRFGYLWPASAAPAQLRPAVARIFAAMEIPEPEPLELGILFRGHHPEATGTLAEFIAEIQRAADSSWGPIAVLADSCREEIAAALGSRAIAQQSPPMAHDLDRTATGVREYLTEWPRLLACHRVVTNCPGSAILWPAHFDIRAPGFTLKPWRFHPRRQFTG